MKQELKKKKKEKSQLIDVSLGTKASHLFCVLSNAEVLKPQECQYEHYK